MISRISWYAALIALVIATIAAQLDRQSAIAPSLALLTPEPARSFAQAQLTARALRDGSTDRALEEAKVLVERRPVPAETLRLLAQAQFAAGKVEDGFVTIQVAAKRGWRDPAAQEAMLRLALAAGDEAEAAHRYTALMLQNRTEDALLEEFGEALFARDTGEATRSIAGVLAGTDRWTDTFLRRGVRTLPPNTFVQIIGEALERGAQIDCGEISKANRPLALRSARAASDLQEIAARRCSNNQ